MTDTPRKMDEMIRFFREREKELECIYRIEEILKAPHGDVAATYDAIVAAIPPGWQYPEVCTARLSIGTDSYYSPGFVETPWVQSAGVTVQGKNAGEIAVYYTKEMPLADDGPFLTHEARLLKAIADRLGSFVLHRRIEAAAGGTAETRPGEGEGAWEVILDLLRQTDPALFATVSEKMLNILCWSGVDEAERLRERAGAGAPDAADEPSGLVNRPHERNEFEITRRLSREIFAIATEHYTDDQILAYLRKWIQDDNLKFLMRVASRNLTLVEIIDALRQYRDMSHQGVDLSLASKRGIVVSLITRFLSSQPSYIRVAKGFCDVADFFEFLDRVIYTADSHGKLGGKTAGLFLAKQILRKSPESNELLLKVKTPKSWYIASDVLLSFLSYNNMDEVVEQKYKDINDVRREYPHVIQAFKNGRFPPEIVQGLSVALDDFEDRPLIVRSSSLLEDSSGAAFSGKYRSLFIANQGTKQERLDALMDAIAEVYASIVGPDPIEYRGERGLLDINEEMGIMIQEVVGTRVGQYFFPAVAGVAFSRNEFRWSPRIRREDGLIRMVPGLGTRAVDRVSDDYPVLVAPGQPGLRVNVAPEEIVYYSPKKRRRHQPRDQLVRDHRGQGTAGAPRTGHAARREARLRVRRRAPSHADGDERRLRDGRRRVHVRGARRQQQLREAGGRDPEGARGEARRARGHRVRPRRHGLLPPAVPSAELRRAQRAGADPQGHPQGVARLLGEPLRVQRAHSRHHAHRVRGSREVQRPARARRPHRRGPLCRERSTSSCPSGGSS